MTSGPSGDSPRGKGDADALLGEIQRTERRISAEAEALSAKLSPAHIKQRTREQMGAIKNRIVEGTGQFATNVRDTGYQAGTASVAMVRRHPISAALVGAMFGWLFWRIMGPRLSGARERAAERGRPVRDRVSERASAAGESLRGVGQEARERTAQARERAASTVQRTRSGVQRAAVSTRDAYANRPLAMIGIVAAVGLGIGLLVPTSRREIRALRPYQERAKERMSAAGERARHVVSESARAGMSAARDTAKHEVHHRGSEE